MGYIRCDGGGGTSSKPYIYLFKLSTGADGIGSGTTFNDVVENEIFIVHGAGTYSGGAHSVSGGEELYFHKTDGEHNSLQIVRVTSSSLTIRLQGAGMYTRFRRSDGGVINVSDIVRGSTPTTNPITLTCNDPEHAYLFSCGAPNIGASGGWNNAYGVCTYTTGGSDRISIGLIQDKNQSVYAASGYGYLGYLYI